MIFSSFKWKLNQVLHLSDPQFAYLYFKGKRLNLLSGRIEEKGIGFFFDEMERLALQEVSAEPRVTHFFYECGSSLLGFDLEIGEDEPLVLDISYQHFKFLKTPKSKISKIKLKTFQRPSWNEYRDAFNQIQDHLVAGNCYQVNLTYPFDFFTDEFFDPRDLTSFLLSRAGCGAYAHTTFVDETLYLSNSPECLFHFENEKIFSLPIKGTVKKVSNFKTHWKELIQDQKQEAELFMIIDLLKNDLNKIDLPETKIKKFKAPLIVPGLIHQYAHLELSLSNSISLRRVFEGLFPGGSITGAPKKKVMSIIREVESWKRRFYTGSTLLCFEGKKISNINIRSAEIHLAQREWRYGAGGGITLHSKAAQEFREMESKVDSFLTLLFGS